MGITNSWNSHNVCDYKGFACDRKPDRPKALSLAALDFNGYSFNGPNFQIKNLLDRLLDLAIFHVNSNKFTGFVPKDIGVGKINFLYELDLSNNKYKSEFPKTVLEAKNLTFLDIRFNSFSGSVPAQVFTLDLDVLFLNNNQFSSNLPENIGKTPALYLTFAYNHFSGPIPSSIGQAKNLLEVLFLGNKFSGCLPYEIGFLSKTTLFDASFNKLTGPIPHSFACLAKIEILNLAKNELYGPVPEQLCKLPNLRKLSLSSNYFTQVGPECRKLISLKRLDVRKNCILDLPKQREASECKNFFSKQRRCPNERSLSYVPCRNIWYLSSKHKVDHQQPLAAAPPPKSYDALSPNNKIRF